jgi:peptidoglycan glycosyltransferase
MTVSGINPNSWRDYRRRLHKLALRRYIVNRATLLSMYLVLIGIIHTGSWILAYGQREGHESVKTGKWEDTRPERYVKKDLPALLRGLNLDLTALPESYLLVREGVKLSVEIPLDTALQRYVVDLLRRSRTFQAAVVVLSPKTGQILAMADYEKHGRGEEENLCLKADFPAASLFKIVSAAAAIEASGFTPDKTVDFQGMTHTLYNNQLKQGEGSYTRKTSFKKAFSRSINPVFGKIGIYDLGSKSMAEYADRFLFNHEIPFDLPLAMSSIHIPADDFGLAEIASGFNRRTLISPLHASLITAAVANGGIMVEPWLVRRVKEESGKVLYSPTLSRLGRPIEQNTARQLRILMEDTVFHGTCRKAFQPLRRKKLFKDIELGAKTGTINDYHDRYKYDWVTAYALPKHGDGAICITVLTIHGKKLGIRASEVARYIINHHFAS